MEMGKVRARSAFAGIDLLLTVMAVALAAIGAVLLWRSPSLWSGYLTLLDVRCWTPWKAVGLGIAAMQGLLVIRHWPDTNPKRQRGKLYGGPAPASSLVSPYRPSGDSTLAENP